MKRRMTGKKQGVRTPEEKRVLQLIYIDKNEKDYAKMSLRKMSKALRRIPVLPDVPMLKEE